MQKLLVLCGFYMKSHLRKIHDVVKWLILFVKFFVRHMSVMNFVSVPFTIVKIYYETCNYVSHYQGGFRVEKV